MKKVIAVIGSNGQLGSDICKEFENNGNTVISLTHNDLDIASLASVRNCFSDLKVNIAINTAAYHNVEKCEADSKKSFEINAVGAHNLALIANEQDFYLIHISTDYVFDGKQNSPYKESDLPMPLNIYGTSKLAGEHNILAVAKRGLVMRVSGLYGKSPCRAKGGINFVQLMQKLGTERDEVRVVNDEFLTPTSTLEIARQIVVLSRKELHGLCHATAEGSCSWYEFAQEIFAITGIKTTLNVASSDEFPAKVNRPNYSVLENTLLKENNCNTFKPWKEGLQEYLKA